MYVLTCPSCERRTGCKYARAGARAKCPHCGAGFVLNDHTLSVDEPRPDDLFAAWKRRPAASADAGSDVAEAALVELAEATHARRAVRDEVSRSRRRRPVRLVVTLQAMILLGVGGALIAGLRWSGSVGPAPVDAAPHTAPTPEPDAVEPDVHAVPDLPAVRFVR